MGTQAALQVLFVAMIQGIFLICMFVIALYEGRGGKKQPTQFGFLSSSVKPMIPQGVTIICGTTFYKDDNVFKAVMLIKKQLFILISSLRIF